METNNKIALSRQTLIRKPYRSLLKGERGHAAFDEKSVKPLMDELKGWGPILDPMSGYGSLLGLCSKRGIPSISIEINVPLYLWQLIRNPNLTQIFIKIIDRLLDEEDNWPKIRKRADVSNSWFLPDALDILKELIKSITLFSREIDISFEIKPKVIAAAVIVPFCGRLSCYIESENNPTWVKQGSIVVYKDWENDFKNYLRALRFYLVNITDKSVPDTEHKIILGDCRKIRFRDVRFHALLTSPPYPNRLDYHKMFWPETAFCDALDIPEIKPFPPTEYIGSTVIKGTFPKRFSSKIVNEFLDYVQSLDTNESRRNDNKKYYYPYYANYFHSLYEAYKNIFVAIDSDVLGYIIVQNNHFRKKEVPVAQAVLEILKNFGFDAETIYTKEVFHTGTLNPRARGIKAKQLQFIIKVVK